MKTYTVVTQYNGPTPGVWVHVIKSVNAQSAALEAGILLVAQAGLIGPGDKNDHDKVNNALKGYSTACVFRGDHKPISPPKEEPIDPLAPHPPIAHSDYDGVRCPLCKAEHTMEGRNLTATDNGAEYEMECNECGATWSEQLDVTGYTYLCDKEGNEIKIPE